jgi:superfamily II DNA helicase RecQ
VIAATLTFAMGIDRLDVRVVNHHMMSKGLEEN